MLKEEIVRRITALLNFISIIVAKEEHSTQGHNLHIGILLDKGIHQMSEPRTSRKMFPEFEGAQLHVSFNKAWGPCESI